MDWNALHPYPRYGAAVALAAANRRPDQVNEQELAALVATALDHALGRFMVRSTDDLETATTLTFDWVRAADLAPGTANGQIAAKGYYLAPHVTTSDGSAAGLAKVVAAFRDAVHEGQPLDKPAPLQRTFAPLVAKVNSGKASLSDPRASFLEVALTALASVTPDKPAAWDGSTSAIIPDLPLVDGEHAPLLDFVDLFRRMRDRYARGEVMTTPPKKGGGYRRPRLHDGNFPEALRGGAIGTTAVVAAIGWWARHAEDRAEIDPEGWARRVLDLLAERPLYVVSYDGTRQERFGHHLVGLALHHDLGAILRGMRSTLPLGADNWKDPKVDLFRMMADRFLRLFTRPTFHDFLAFRTEYPPALLPVLNAYFTSDAMNLSPELVASARFYGAALNRAAYFAAKAEVGDDQRRRGGALREIDDYKQRALVEFESAVQSAKSGPELLAKVGSRAGRLTGFDLPPESAPFMEAVASESITIDDARSLVTAFMRLSTWKPKNETSDGTDDSTSDSTPPHVDLSPDDRS